MPIKVIDLFAGPGGLGEGFSALEENGEKAFKIAVSIEKESSAHRTLLLRSLYRQYSHEEIPEEYYAFLRGELGKNPEDELYRLPHIHDALETAKQEAQKLTLGLDNQKLIYQKIRNNIGKEECVLIGGPPCQAYSLAGRSRNMGDKNKNYNPLKDKRNFLYVEYLKIIAKFQPVVFVMENVKGILSAKVGNRNIFSVIERDLQDPVKATKVKPDKGRLKSRYKIFSLVKNKNGDDLFQHSETKDPHDFIIRMENYGVPQARHRVILLGVREDLADVFYGEIELEKNNHKPGVEEVIYDLPEIRSSLSREKDSIRSWRSTISDIQKKTLKQMKKDKVFQSKVYDNLLHNIKKIKLSPESTGSEKGIKKTLEFNNSLYPELRQWYEDTRLDDYIINHESRGHMRTDLHRYMYYSVYADTLGVSPTSADLPKVLWPQHKNFGSGKFADRFRVQIKNRPATTITCHISKDGHYFIHPDPLQCRSLTVREAARIQTFPDNYYFVGTRTQQYVQVGNAVPPLLSYQIAKIVYSISIKSFL